MSGGDPRACGEHDLAFDEEAFRSALGENLAECRFTLVIAVDEITDDLRRIIEYRSGHTNAEVGVVALKLGYLAEGDGRSLCHRSTGLSW